MGFRILSQEEFDRLSVKERVEYLRQGIAALEDLKDQIRAQILQDTGERLRHLSAPEDK